MGLTFSQDEMFKLISDIDPSNTGQINYADFKSNVIDIEVQKQVGSDVTELLDAYVAMGGESDGGGCVDAGKLIQTIKHELLV